MVITWFFYVAFSYNCIQIPAVCAHYYSNSAIYIQALVYILKTSVLVYISFVNFVPSQRTWHCVLCNFDSLGDPSSCMDKDKEQYLAAPTVQAFLFFKKNMCTWINSCHCQIVTEPLLLSYDVASQKKRKENSDYSLFVFYSSWSAIYQC